MKMPLKKVIVKALFEASFILFTYALFHSTPVYTQTEKVDESFESKVVIKDVTESIYLIKDVSKTLYLDFMPGHIIIANPKICNFIAIREQKKIMLIPSGEGTTSLTIQDTTGKVRHQIKIFVKVSDLARIAKELKTLLQDIEGLEIKIIGKKVLIDGEILLPKDFNRIVAVANQYDLKT